MQVKRACLVINPRAGANLAKITDVIAVLSAAGWKTDIAIKEYGGHTKELAANAGKKYDLVIGYGGDGTISQVVNGVMSKKKHNIVGAIPGGTANVWASEVGIPTDPVKAALTLINSEPRKVDVGHVAVERLIFPTNDDTPVVQNGRLNGSRKKNKAKSAPSSDARQNFLLMAGLGIDAAVMGDVSKPLKYKVGTMAVGVAALKKLPEQRAFPVELRAVGGGADADLLWHGEALQVVIGNTRRYADVVEMTPDAYIDDGVLDVCVITAGTPVSNFSQVASLLLRRKPDNATGQFFHGAHLTISVPASIALQVDGSMVKLKDYVSKADWTALQDQEDLSKVMVTYCFDAQPKALEVEIPTNYNNTLFEDDPHPTDEPEAQKEDTEHLKEENEEPSHHEAKVSEKVHQESLEAVSTVMKNGRKVTVIGMAPNPAEQGTFIIAGTSPKSTTGEEQPVAVRVTKQTQIVTHAGKELKPDLLLQLRENEVIVAEGRKSKRYVIDAKRLVVEDRDF
ncbi:MAG TPA: diacylglycerol kinase family protein [Ktedonobacteraceae bacterium]|nr:diacylglycerol kinase family protein [Ktedonobacteraceae bacterium]